jgi:hypothetical protein
VCKETSVRIAKSIHVSLLILLLLTVSLPAEQTVAAQQDVLTHARSAYYSLAKKGFKGFTATVEPNWDVILAQTATPANLKVFRDVKFAIVVDENGAVTVTHELGPNASKPDLAPTVDRIHYHVQRLVTGFFNTWRSFVVNSPIPDTEIKIENTGKQYRVSYGTPPGEVTLTMSSDFSITETHFAGPTVKRTVKPEFQKTADGFLLTAYKQLSEPVGDGVKTTLDFHIDYQDLNGMKVPQKVRLSGVYGGEPIAAELTFILTTR